MAASILELNSEIALKADVFRDSPRDQALPLIRTGKLLKIDRGDIVFLQDESAHSLFIVLDGWVKLNRVSSSGVESVVSILGREELLGMVCAMTGEVYPTNAEAVSDLRLLQIEADAVQQAMRDNAKLCHSFLEASVRRNKVLVKQIEQIKSHSGAQRIAGFLRGLCRVDCGSCSVDLPFDKALIASWLGVKPETLSRVFKRLQPYGVDVSKNHATISSVERLTRFIEGDMPPARRDAPLNTQG